MDLLHRIRWANVARAAALVAAVLLVVAWPRLRADPPALPPQPVVEEQAPVPGGEAAGEAGGVAVGEGAASPERGEWDGTARRGDAPETRRRRATRHVEERAGPETRGQERERAEARRRERRAARRRRAAERRRVVRRQAVERPRPRVEVPPVATAPAPRTWTPPRTEFGFEGR